MNQLWDVHNGRELDTTPLDDRPSYRLVACLNVWNDRRILERTVPSWKDQVAHVIVVDGSYGTTGQATLSTDGTREYLASVFPSIEFVDMPGATQCEKRTAYLERGTPNDFLFVIDADEVLVHRNGLDWLPECDIGWVRIRSPLYSREYGQPRIFRWRPGLHYSGRHHWIYEGTRLFCTHQYGGPGFNHRTIDVVLSNQRNLARSPEHRAAKSTNAIAQNRAEFPLSAAPYSIMSDSATRARECLHILTYAYRDDGFASSRLHTAINRTTPHSSVFFRLHNGPFNIPTQYEILVDRQPLAVAQQQADIIHVHTLMEPMFPPRTHTPVVLHHHGTRMRMTSKKYAAEAKRHRALVFVSNLELLSWAEDYPAVFLPNVMPVARYRQLADSHSKWDGTTSFRIAHSPTHRERKGTAEFLRAVERLQKNGYDVEPVMIERLSHADSLRIKATCHALFDSFWLGIQCSGLEAASMNLPVIAGDETVAARYKEYFGGVPYTFADDEESLEWRIQCLMEDPLFYAEEAARVNRYTVEYHDESAVTLAYLDHLDHAFDWRSKKITHAASCFAAR